MAEKVKVEDLLAKIAELEGKLEKKGDGKKGELFNILIKEGGGVGGKGISILDISNLMAITERNVSSLKCYLKKEGVLCGKRSNGKVYIEEVLADSTWKV